MAKAPEVVREIVLELEKQMLFGDICPGQKLLSQRHMAAELGVSRASVREAITALQTKGLIATRHGGGSFCINLLESFYQQPLPSGKGAVQEGEQSNHELQRQVMEMREMLEGEAAYFAAQRATDRQLQALTEEHRRMLQRSSGETTLKKAKADLTFHMLIAESSHNLLVMSISQVLYTRYFNAIYGVLSRTLQKTGRYPPRIGIQHSQIYEAIMAREPDAARQAAVEHMRYTRQQLTDSFNR